MSGFPITNRINAPHQIAPFLEQDSYYSFLGQLAHSDRAYRYISFTFPIQIPDPLACLEILSDGSSFEFFWEKPNQSISMAAASDVVTLQASGSNRFREIDAKSSKIIRQTAEYSAVKCEHAGIYFLGGFSFFDEQAGEEWSDFPPAHFTVPEWHIIKESGKGYLTITIATNNLSRPGQIDRRLRFKLSRFSDILGSDSEIIAQEPVPARKTDSSSDQQAYLRWIDSIENAKDLIRNKKFNKIVLARNLKVESSHSIPPTQLINILRGKYPNCYNFLIRPRGEATFICSSPERMASLTKNNFETGALAGSMQRGSTASRDALLEEKLTRSPKDLAEHKYVVKAIKEQLYPIASHIENGENMSVKKLNNIQHLYTPVTGALRDTVNHLSVIERLHPTPAVGGYPWEKAAPYLKKLENFNRGWYAGPVGWLRGHSRSEFAVAIRSALINEKEMYFYAGCGIINDSDPEAEWRETNLKLMPMLSALTND